jgi:hypothetical protein
VGGCAVAQRREMTTRASAWSICVGPRAVRRPSRARVRVSASVGKRASRSAAQQAAPDPELGRHPLPRHRQHEHAPLEVDPSTPPASQAAWPNADRPRTSPHTPRAAPSSGVGEWPRCAPVGTKGKTITLAVESAWRGLGLEKRNGCATT